MAAALLAGLSVLGPRAATAEAVTAETVRSACGMERSDLIAGGLIAEEGDLPEPLAIPTCGPVSAGADGQTREPVP